MLTTILAYLIVIVFFLVEGRTRKSAQAKSMEAGGFDRSSTKVIVVCFVISWIALLCAPVLNYFAIAPISNVYAGWFGLAVALAGMALRLWANEILGAYYTRTLRVAEQQPVVQDGPYRFIRHPGYLGVILMFSGAGLGTANWITAAAALLAMSGAYYYRIRTEEAMLIESLGQPYAEYRGRTWKLIPFIY